MINETKKQEILIAVDGLRASIQNLQETLNTNIGQDNCAKDLWETRPGKFLFEWENEKKRISKEFLVWLDNLK